MEQEVEDSKTKAKMHGAEVGKLSARIEALTQELAEAQDNLGDQESILQSKLTEKIKAVEAAKSTSDDLRDKLQLTNQMLYDAQNLASGKDSEIEDWI